MGTQNGRNWTSISYAIGRPIFGQMWAPKLLSFGSPSVMSGRPIPPMWLPNPCMWAPKAAESWMPIRNEWAANSTDVAAQSLYVGTQAAELWKPICDEWAANPTDVAAQSLYVGTQSCRVLDAHP